MTIKAKGRPKNPFAKVLSLDPCDSSRHTIPADASNLQRSCWCARVSSVACNTVHAVFVCFRLYTQCELCCCACCTHQLNKTGHKCCLDSYTRRGTTYSLAYLTLLGQWNRLTTPYLMLHTTAPHVSLDLR